MLEKLKYRDSVKVLWNYDVTTPKEAERYLNEMASNGYRLKMIAGRGHALFIRENMRPAYVYCVAAVGTLEDEK